MMTVDEYVRSLLDHELVSREDIGGARLQALTQADPLTVKALASELVRQGKLTKYQATTVWQGKADELCVDNYIIHDVIGQGGMGSVYKGAHRRLKRPVAIKMLSPESLKLADAVDRFQRETEVVGKLSHRNIVSALDAGESHGRHFLVMEFCDGIDLDRLIAKQGPLPAMIAAACVLQGARGLASAHARGVLHRDVKPANLLLVEEEGQPVVKLLDLGLAWSRDTGSSSTSSDPSGRLTQNDRIMGTVTYMAPEQALEIHSADQRADIYSLGCTWFFLVAGRAIYEGESILKRLVAHREAPIPDLPGASEPLNRVYRQMVAKRPEERFAAMTDVIAALERCGVTDAQAGGALDLSRGVPAPVPAANGKSTMSAAFAEVPGRDPAVDKATIHKTLVDKRGLEPTAIEPELLAPLPGGRPAKGKPSAKSPPRKTAKGAKLPFGLIAAGMGLVVVLLGGFGVWSFSRSRGTTPTPPAAAVAAINTPTPPPTSTPPGTTPPGTTPPEATPTVAPPDMVETTTPTVTTPPPTTPPPTTPPPTTTINLPEAEFNTGVLGEYLGTIAGEPWGFQVRRAAEAGFVVRMLEGGLPGAGWNQQTAYSLAASRLGNELKLDQNPRLAGSIRNGELVGTSAVGEGITAARQTRVSPTLLAEPPMNAVALFLRGTPELWRDAQVTPDGDLSPGATTQAAYGDFRLHLEYRATQAGAKATSLLKLQNRYGLSLGDGYGQDVTSEGPLAWVAGDLPALNMTFPTGEWQTLDLAFAAPRFDASGVKSADARCTVKHNGVVVHDNVALRPLPGVTETPDPGPLVLGSTGDVGLVFRHIWLEETRAAGLLSASRSEWPAPGETWQKRIKSAAGLLHDDFTFVQTLPYDEFAKLAEGLQVAGYRPVRLRPYAGSSEVLTAALWTRDGLEWQTTTGDAAETHKTATKLLAEGFWPEDIAGYAKRSDETYVTLWVRHPEPPATEARVYAGVRHLSLKATFTNLPNEGYAERIDQAFTMGRALTLHSTIWWKSPTKTEGWFGDAGYFEGNAKGVLIDLCIGKGPLSGGPAYAWCSLVEPPPNLESTQLHGLAPDAHVRQCQELIDQGYRPVAIGAANVNAPVAVQGCSVWHRAKTP